MKLKPLDCQARRLHNAVGSVFPLAPMRLKFTITKSRNCRLWLAVPVLLSILFSLVPVAAQSKSRKQITSVWTSTSAEGSFVTVASDSSLNDYEAYTRGDRFYVRIPLADLPNARGSLLGRGFDDVQIQRYGDGLILSFHLLPGTKAHVDQKPNRLEIVFSPPGSKGFANEVANRTRARRITDSAGPVPPTSTSVASRAGRSGRRHAGTARAMVASAAPNKRRPKAKLSESNAARSTNEEGRSKAESQTSKASGNTGSQPAGSKTESSGAMPTSTVSPAAQSASNSASPAAGSSSPKVSPAASPAASQSSSAVAAASPMGSPGTQATPANQESISSASTPAPAPPNQKSDWSSRLHYYQVWAELNWLPLVIAGIVFLILLLLLFWRRSKRQLSVAAKDAKGTTAASRARKVEAPEQSKKQEGTVEPAGASPANRTQGGLARSSPDSALKDEATAEEEREVIEL
jgi:hypothetical protein